MDTTAAHPFGFASMNGPESVQAEPARSPDIPRNGSEASSVHNVARQEVLLEVMNREGAALLRMLQRMLGNRADALDAYQECFCKLASRTQGQSIEHLKAYMYRTASNIAIESLRARKRRLEHMASVAAVKTRIVEEQAADIAAGSREPGDDDDSSGCPSAINDRNEVLLRDAIDRLPLHLRHVVILRDICRLPYEEVGRVLEIEPGTARVYRRHAIVRLGKMMGANQQEGGSQ